MLASHIRVLAGRNPLLRIAQKSALSQRFFHNTRSNLAVTPFLLADIGEGIAEVEIMKWYVKKGDKVKAFDKLCEVQSDKATVEITSRFDGEITAVHSSEGDIVKVGAALVDIDRPEAAGGAAATASTPAPAAPKAATPASTSGSRVVPFLLADIGEGIAEVELMQWFVKKGDTVKAFDKLCEVQSDKATVEITSRYDGVVTSVHHNVGQIVKVGAALVDIEVKGAAPASAPGGAAPAARPPTSATIDTSSNSDGAQSRPTGGPVLTTPSVRKIAKENNVALHTLPGLGYATGPKGRILKEDILNYIKSGGSRAAPAAAPTQAAAPVATPSVATPAPAAGSAAAAFFAPGESTKVVPIRGVQRLMVKSMDAARQIQTFLYADEITVDKLVSVRGLLAAEAKRNGLKFSYMPLLLKATSLALSAYPQLNSSVNADASEVTYYAAHHIGIAMDTPKGLIVPVIRDVQSKSMMEISNDIARLQAAANNNTLSPADLQGGTFTLSNIGSIGGTYMMPVLVVPQVMIGAIGKFQVVPRYTAANGDAASSDAIYGGDAVVRPATVMNVSWSADHRVIDGATVARFSNHWKALVENPTAMLGQLR